MRNLINYSDLHDFLQAYAFFTIKMTNLHVFSHTIVFNSK